ncbi:MAG: hypothetical protein ABW220_00375 [Burkholderiaceae bacterium]
MTSEVLILNKKAVVIGADSAVTTSSGNDRPRYSKSANKIFELTQRGSVAAAIYGSAGIDGVPWESESVGGPIDIAAITKAEGLVWIQRKHYFDVSNNARYLSRLSQSFKP